MGSRCSEPDGSNWRRRGSDVPCGLAPFCPGAVVSPLPRWGVSLDRSVRAGTSSIERDQHGKATWRNAPHSRPPQSRRPEAGGDQRGIPRRLGGAKTLARGTDTSAGQFRKLRRRAQGEPEAKMIGDALGPLSSLALAPMSRWLV